MTQEVFAAGAAPEATSLVYPAGDVAALRDRLNAIIGDPTLRARLANEAWRAAAGQPRWRDAAQAILRAIEFAHGVSA